MRCFSCVVEKSAHVGSFCSCCSAHNLTVTLSPSSGSRSSASENPDAELIVVVPAASTALPLTLPLLLLDPLDDEASVAEEVGEDERDDGDEPESDELLEESDREVSAEPDDDLSVLFDECLLPLRLPLLVEISFEFEGFLVVPAK